MDRRAQLFSVVSAVSADEAIAAKYTAHLEALFDVITPERIGYAFCSALDHHDYAAAVKACAAYFRQKADNPLPGLSADGGYSLDAAENCVRGIARSVNIDWTFPDGEIDFLFDPTARTGTVNHEWLWQFNRHAEWSNLARAYRAVGDERYAQTFRRQLLKWIAQTDIPTKWNAPGSAWRTIECGIRLLGNWQVAFDGFKRSATVDDAVLLLMIASMHRQAVHLVKHPTGKNWLMMEANGVYTFSSLFPELSDSADNRAIAVGYLLDEMKSQILPDGMHNELSPDYQSVVLGCAANFYQLAVSLGAADEIPQAFTQLIRDTVDAAVLLSTPGFTQPRTNDCYTIPTNRFTGRAAALLGDTPQYKFVNTRRAEGEPPRGETASAYLPYAGFAVMRADWGPDAAYLCFDVGPLGLAHVHQDKLNINIYKGAKELIYDDGGGQYELSAARTYALSGYGHNTVLVDGLAQNRKAPAAVTEPIDAGWISTPTYDYAAAVYDDTFGPQMTKPASHRREVRFCRPDFFVVTDTLTSADGNVHDYEALFHLDTTAVTPIPAYKNAVISNFGGEYEIIIIPLDEEGAEVTLDTVSGVTEPMMQGWYNGRNEACLHEAITVSRRVSGVRDFRLTTLLIPLKTGDALPQVSRDAQGNVTVRLNGRMHRFDPHAMDQPG